MTDVAVAFDAEKHVAARFLGEHVLHKIAVAVKAGVLRDPRVAWFDLDRLVKISRSER